MFQFVKWCISGASSGDNPNNTDTGFVQLYDTANAAVISAFGGWTNRSLTTFALTITGANPADYHHLWTAWEISGAAGDTAGAFSSYASSIALLATALLGFLGLVRFRRAT